MSTVAEAVHAKNTAAFIDENPTSIVFTERKRVKTTAGGYRWEDQDDLLAVTGRMVFSSNKGDNVQRTLPDGEIVTVSATLILPPGSVAGVGWTFEYEDRKWRVAQVARTPAWRVSCEVGYA